VRRAIPAVSEKMLIQRLRQMERDGVVRRFVHHQTSGPYMREGAMTVDAYE
jgi:DNA-binding HxlR family transcriptional regulator